MRARWMRLGRLCTWITIIFRFVSDPGRLAETRISIRILPRITDNPQKGESHLDNGQPTKSMFATPRPLRSRICTVSIPYSNSLTYRLLG